MWQLNSASGFYKSSVCKCVLGASMISSFALNFPLHHYQRYFVYNPSFILEKHQIWRLLTAKVAFLDLKDLMVGSILIYYFRIFERRYGSKKFLAHLLGTFIISTILEMSLASILRSLEVKLDSYPSGPFWIIYPLFVPYFCDIPRVELGHVVGIPMTGKSFQYFLGLQIASGSLESLLVAICGIMSGILWKHNFLKVQNLIKIPDFMARISYSIFGRLVESPEPKNMSLPMGATIELQRQEHLDQLEQQAIWQSLRQPTFGQPRNFANGPGIFGAGNLNPGNGPEYRELEDNAENGGSANSGVSEEKVQQLVDMGFGADRVRRALQISNNDINVATSVLIQET